MALDVEMLTVGAVAENCFLLRREGSDRLLVVDPGEEAERILAAIEATGAQVEAILITHCHFDHIGAVTPVARATGGAGLLPRDRGAAARRHHGLRPLGGIRAV